MFLDLIKKTRSCRRYDSTFTIGYEVLESLVNIARYSPSSGNRQPLKYMLSCEQTYNDLIFECIGWAGYLEGWMGPSPTQKPSAYIILFTEKEFMPHLKYDPGIVAHSICLAAAEQDIASCILSSIDNSRLIKLCGLTHEYEIVLVIALGQSAETIILQDIAIGESIKYYRDESGNHIVPKRRLTDIVYRIAEERD